MGRLHGPAHKKECVFKFSFNWLPGVAITDGEAPERICAILNGLASRAQEMSSCHRHDVINDFYSDWNVRRVHGISESID